LNAVRLLPLLGALVLLGVEAPKAGARGKEEPDQVRVVKFLSDPQPARQDVVVFKYPEIRPAPADSNYTKRLVGLSGETIVIKDGVVFNTPGPVIERITVEGGKVEITGNTIKIEGGKVEIIRQPRP
jgi:hypothetical protein